MNLQQPKLINAEGMKARWLSMLYYGIGKQASNFWITCTWLQDGEIQFSKWLTYLDFMHPSKYHLLGRINQRTLLNNEVVLEYDGEFTGYLNLIRSLKADGLCFRAYATANYRATHIHCFFDDSMLLMSQHEREQFRLGLIERYGCDPALKSDKHMVALEYCPHWKTGQVKELMAYV